ncbi:MAG: ABC transporter permease, partial [Prevotellaceae bacterium]|nr:ABC transporter permease [Prevotellaceae bacterium]
MKLGEQIRKNIAYYARYYKLVATAVLITVAVITGSLAVGDSVRATLIKRVTERLGDTETIIFSRHSFIDEQLGERLSSVSNATVRGMLLTNGFVSQNGKLIPVFVWGTDEYSIPEGSTKLNDALMQELGQPTLDALVLRLPATGLIPSGSLFVTDTYTTSMRLSYAGVVPVAEGGNISMKNEQQLPLNIFVNRKELAEVMKTSGKINLLLSDKPITTEQLQSAWNVRMSGLSVAQRDSFTEITSDRVFLQNEVVRTLYSDNHSPNRLFSYLANTIKYDNKAIPYSFVTALDRYQGEPLQSDEIILSDYTAMRLRAKVGDNVRMSYFVSEDLKTLKTDSLLLRVKLVVPLSELRADTTLSADFPGLSDVKRCTEWDSDLPIDMSLITDEDERYWERYRSTPKALVAYAAVSADWSNAYGSATALRVANLTPNLSGLQPEMFGIIEIDSPREFGLFAAKHGVDFSGLFLALGCFIIFSALLLMSIPLSEMLYQRRHEITLLKAIGYTRQRIAKMLWREAAPIVLVSSIGGVITGLLYTAIIMWLLGNLWQGATHTDGFSLSPNLITPVIGLVIGIGLSLLMLRSAIHRNLKERPQPLIAHQTTKKQRIIAIISTVLTLFLIGVNLFFLRSVTLFVAVGVLLLATATFWGDYIVCRNGTSAICRFRPNKLVWNTLFAGRKQNLRSFLSLAIGVFIVFSVGLNRQGFADSMQLRTGTGGYSLWCESTVPIYHNMATPDGREKLSLTDLSDAEIVQCLRYSADEASCLNLNKVTTPTILGIDMNALSASDFQVTKHIFSDTREDFFRQMQQKQGAVYPALVDETVLMWSLGKTLGDTLYYESDHGQRIAVRLVGLLANSVFQGNILIDRRLFGEIWPETTGSEVFLLKLKESEQTEAKALLEQT